jgi:hypothetical protein
LEPHCGEQRVASLAMIPGVVICVNSLEKQWQPMIARYKRRSQAHKFGLWCLVTAPRLIYVTRSKFQSFRWVVKDVRPGKRVHFDF